MLLLLNITGVCHYDWGFQLSFKPFPVLTHYAELTVLNFAVAHLVTHKKQYKKHKKVRYKNIIIFLFGGFRAVTEIFQLLMNILHFEALLSTWS